MWTAIPSMSILQAYASILYLRKFSNFKIILRGKPIQQLKIADELKFAKTVTYKPQMGMGKEDVSIYLIVINKFSLACQEC